MTTLNTNLIGSLAKGINGEAKRVIIGLNWSYVEGPNGAGLIHTPTKNTTGCKPLPSSGHYQGQALADLANLIKSNNMYERVLGFAAINAHYNRYDMIGTNINGLDLIKDYGGQTVIFGHFPGIEKKLPNAIIIEKENTNYNYPIGKIRSFVCNAKCLAITASALSNGSLSFILENAPSEATALLIGPSAPLSPNLFDIGITAISGFVVNKPNTMGIMISEGASFSSIKNLGNYITLQSQ